MQKPILIDAPSTRSQLNLAEFELVLLFTTNGKRKNNGSALKLLLIQMAKNVRCNFTALESAFNHAAISPERKLLIEMKQF